MKNKNFILILGGVGVIVVIFFILLAAKQFGASYSQSLTSILPTIPAAPQTREKRTVRKITVKDTKGGCLEITPDGIVRSYATCGGDLTDIHREADPKHILELVEMVSQVDESKYQQPGPNTIALVIETDKGTITIYVPAPHGGSSGNSITDTIDLIVGDLPQPTQTPATVYNSPTPTLIGSQPVLTDTPIPTLPPWITPSPTPSQGDQPFSCGFSATDGNGPRPYNVSNYICSTQPSPHP